MQTSSLEKISGDLGKYCIVVTNVKINGIHENIFFSCGFSYGKAGRGAKGREETKTVTMPS